MNIRYPIYEGVYRILTIILCFVFRTKIKNYSVECGNKNVKFIKVKENKRVTYRGN